jgi:DNA-binding NtrC family response regulator
MASTPYSTDVSITSVFRKRGVTFDYFQTHDLSMERLLVRARKLAKLDAPVVILGEPGTGKSLLSQALHNASGRKRAPFRVLSHSDVQAPDLRERLFGTCKEPGFLSLTDGGSLVLDNIQEWPENVQLLFEQFLDFREFPSPLDQSPLHADIRLIATASCEPPEGGLAPFGVIPGLYNRLRGCELRLPPLAARPTDLAFLADGFLARFARRHKFRPARLSPSAFNLLAKRRWYGNLRELDQSMRAATLAVGTGGTIQAEDVPPPLDQPMVDHQLPYRLDGIERWAYERALRASSGNRSQAIHLLGVASATFYRKAKSFGLLSRPNRKQS